ncbi:MAG: YaiI/YqxD family protein, partial [Aeromonas sobria]
VEKGFDVADHVIAQQVTPGDLVITGDIPLASWVIDAGGEALNPRGEIYTRETIKARLGMRNFMEELRSAGVQTGGPAPFNSADKQCFANALDKWLVKGKL